MPPIQEPSPDVLPQSDNHASETCPDEWPALLARARDGDASAVDAVLERYRNYLRSIALRRMARPLRRRIDASDLVQETLLEAHRGIDGLLGANEPQWRAALRQILRCNLANAVRDHMHAAKRRAAQEQPLEAAAGRPDSVATPSLQVARLERAARFAEALSELPPDQAQAVSMRYFEGASVDEVAQALDRSRAAAAGLLKRGLQNLRQVVSAESGWWL